MTAPAAESKCHTISPSTINAVANTLARPFFFEIILSSQRTKQGVGVPSAFVVWVLGLWGPLTQNSIANPAFHMISQLIFFRTSFYHTI